MKSAFSIPESFELHGITYKVVNQVDLIARQDNMGEADYRHCEVTLQTVEKGVPLNPKRREQTFFHELTHMILHEMRSKLRDDEVFVDVFSSLLHQAITTSEYPNEVR